MRIVLLAVAVAMVAFSLVGCGDVAFEHTKAVTDASFEGAVLDCRRPAVVLFHGGLSSGSAHDWGPLVERVARAFPEQVSCFHYDTEKFQQWYGKLNPRAVAGRPVVFNRGKKEAAVDIRMPNEEGRMAQLFMLLDSYLLPSKRFGRGRRAVNLEERYWATDVVESEKPVVLAFDRCGGGG